MITIANIPDPQTVQIPREREADGLHSYTLTLKSVAEGIARAISVTDEGSGRYFAFNIALAEPLRPGEYTYIITRNLVPVASGICTVTGAPSLTWKESDKAGAFKVKEYGD